LVLEKGEHVTKIGTQVQALKYYDRFALRSSIEGFLVYSSIMAGGTTVVSCGNGMPVLEKELLELGVDISGEVGEAQNEMGVMPLRDDLIGKGSRLIMDIGNDLGLDMKPMPKYVDHMKCDSCGFCLFGCKKRAKWTTVDYVLEMQRYGGRILYGTEVRRVFIRNGKASGVVAVKDGKPLRVRANTVILATGGLVTPAILKRSGIDKAGSRLFVDFLNVTFGVLDDDTINLAKEISMAVVSTKYLEDRGFLISPFMFPPLVMATITPKRKLLKLLKYDNLLGIMAKTKDESEGSVLADGRFHKKPTHEDNRILDEGADMARRILRKAGVREKTMFTPKPSGAHPGGSAAIGEVVDSDLKTEVDGLYVCDASVLPESSGAPPIVTIVSLGKRLAKLLLKK